jgi:hypothetical protein
VRQPRIQQQLVDAVAAEKSSDFQTADIEFDERAGDSHQPAKTFGANGRAILGDQTRIKISIPLQWWRQ